MAAADDPATRAIALVHRLFALLQDCRTLTREMEPRLDRQEPAASAAERLAYFGVVAGLEEGLVRAAEHAIKVLEEARQPLGLVGEEWLRQQERTIDPGREA